jgi:hypothetical protein
MSLERARNGAKGTFDEQDKKRKPRLGIYQRFFPPKATPQILGQLTPKQTIAAPLLFLPGQYLDLVDASQKDHDPKSEPDYHRLTHRAKKKPRQQAARPDNDDGGGKWDRFEDYTCSSGFEAHAPKPCVFCYQNDTGIDMRRSHQWCWNVIHLAVYHLVPRTKDNKVVTAPDGTIECYRNQCLSYDLSARLRNVQCRDCANGHEVTFGAHRWLGLGASHQNCVRSWHAEVSQNCAYCGTGIMEVGYDCAHCNKPVVDLQTLTQEEVERYKNHKMPCPHCRQSDFLRIAFECGYDENGDKDPTKGCEADVAPRPRTLFDYVWWAQREGEQTESKIVAVKKRLVTSFKMTIFEGEPDEAEVRLSDELIKHLAPQLFDFEDMLRPMETIEQARVLGIRDPYAPRVAAPGMATPSVIGGSRPAPRQANVPGRPRMSPIPGLTK